MLKLLQLSQICLLNTVETIVHVLCCSDLTGKAIIFQYQIFLYIFGKNAILSMCNFIRL